MMNIPVKNIIMKKIYFLFHHTFTTLQANLKLFLNIGKPLVEETGEI